MAKIVRCFHRAVLPALLLLGAVSGNVVLADPPATLWDMDTLRVAPQTFACPNVSPPGMKAFYYAGPPYHGNPTWVFAYYAAPPGTPPPGGWPGIVLLHGGGGTAYAEWVRRWNNAGFAAIAMDLEGHEPDAVDPSKRQPTPHPGDWLGGYGPTSTEQFPYFAVANAIEANSLLRSLPEVNPAKIGICGISWGSIWTCLAVSIDHRFAFAIPIYGHGYMKESDAACHIMDTWDPSHYLSSAKCPMLFIASTNDKNFSPPPWQKTIDLVGSRAEQLMLPRLTHSQGAADEVPEPYAFANSIVSGAAPSPPTSAQWWYTTDSGPFAARRWMSLPALTSDASARPPGADQDTAWFLLITRSDGTRRSTHITFNAAAEAFESQPALPVAGTTKAQ